MNAAWLVYALAFSAVAGGAAWFAEAALRLQQRAFRGVWLAALVASVAAPTYALTRPLPTMVTLGDIEVVRVAEPAVSAAPTLPTLTWPVLPLGGSLALWALLSGGLAFVVGVALVRTHMLRRRWRPGEIAGTRVLVSDDFGPAVVGVFRPTIVIPTWLLALDDGERDLAIAHEREHLRGGDTRVLAAGSALLLAFPWNPLLWWQFARLRAAVEIDCDRRVVRGGVSRRRYGSLLLDVGTRGACAAPGVAPLAHPPTLLERRLTIMANHTRPASRLRSAALLLLSGSLIAMACEAPAPAALAPEEDEAVDAVPGPSATVAEFRAIELPDGPRTDGEAPPPLIIVDGVIVANFPFSRLDPGDIERVEVIKGGAALRLYGERAAGGVVQITTKAEADEAGTVERRVQPQEPVAAGPDGGTVTRLVERPRPVLVSARKPAPPLIYVDGEPFDGTLEDVNRMSVASVEVLDAAAAASYGPAGANGVVIVTTR